MTAARAHVQLELLWRLALPDFLRIQMQDWFRARLPVQTVEILVNLCDVDPGADS